MMLCVSADAELCQQVIDAKGGYSVSSIMRPLPYRCSRRD